MRLQPDNVPPARALVPRRRVTALEHVGRVPRERVHVAGLAQTAVRIIPELMANMCQYSLRGRKITGAQQDELALSVNAEGMQLAILANLVSTGIGT